MNTARLTFASTSKSSDAYYIAGMPIEDDFAGWEYAGKFYSIASSLELGNFKKHSRCDHVFSMEALAEKDKGTAFIIAKALKKSGAKSAMVGEYFPVGLFIELKKIFPLKISSGPLFPERATKSTHEQEEIKRANKGCAAGIALCAEAIRRSKVSNGRLFLNKKPLTSELLRTWVQELFLRMGLDPVSDLIVAGGRQACDPHCNGSGQLKAKELIVVDLFSPLQSSHYWGDMTRTFIKGAPTDAQAKLVETVAFAQREAILAIKPGIDGKMVHEEVAHFFEKNGYKTGKTPNGYVGFFHGTGHGLGLDCHDLSEHGWRINSRHHILQENEVYTVEPGLYYPEIGGCRIEDNGVVAKKGFKLLSKAPYEWVL